jgi:hypothetical protein
MSGSGEGDLLATVWFHPILLSTKFTKLLPERCISSTFLYRDNQQRHSRPWLSNVGIVHKIFGCYLHCSFDRTVGFGNVIKSK